MIHHGPRGQILQLPRLVLSLFARQEPHPRGRRLSGHRTASALSPLFAGIPATHPPLHQQLLTWAEPQAEMSFCAFQTSLAQHRQPVLAVLDGVTTLCRISPKRTGM